MAIDRYTIKLKSYLDVFIEKKAAGKIYPGQLVLLGSGDTFTYHNDDAPVNCVPMFAIEDALQGKGIDDAYASGDWMRVWIPTRGDVVYAIAEDQHNYTIGTFVESNGDGFVQPYTSGKVVGMVVEALDLSGSSDRDDSSEAPFSFAKRIKIMVV